MNKYLKIILWPAVCLRRISDNHLKRTNPEKLFSKYHKRMTGKPLDYDNPTSLNEKIAYLEFRTDTSEWSRLADKIAVRDYVTECGYGDSLTQLYGTYKAASEIDYDKLPDRFVIKTNNGSATNIFVKDKKTADIQAINKQLDDWLKIDYGFDTCQPHYSKIPPMILAEEYLEDKTTASQGKMLLDYKFYCVNGEPYYVFIYQDRLPNTHVMKRMIYDMNWSSHPEYVGKYAVVGYEIPKPKSFDLMKEMAAKLSAPFPFVRVDFYEVNGKPFFGEMTFTPAHQEASVEFLDMLGKIMKI